MSQYGTRLLGFASEPKSLLRLTHLTAPLATQSAFFGQHNRRRTVTYASPLLQRCRSDPHLFVCRNLERTRLGVQSHQGRVRPCDQVFERLPPATKPPSWRYSASGVSDTVTRLPHRPIRTSVVLACIAGHAKSWGRLTCPNWRRASRSPCQGCRSHTSCLLPRRRRLLFP